MSITIITLDNSVSEALATNKFKGFSEMSPETQAFIKSCDRYDQDWGIIRFYKQRALVGEGNAYTKDSTGEIVIQNLANREGMLISGNL